MLDKWTWIKGRGDKIMENCIRVYMRQGNMAGDKRLHLRMIRAGGRGVGTPPTSWPSATHPTAIIANKLFAPYQGCVYERIK